MSKYTTEVRYICEVEAGLEESVGFNSVDDVIARARSGVFSFNYPIFDTDYKEQLETKILRHYYTREIGMETVGLWKLRLQMKMTEIMPYYNQLYESAKLEFNPFYDVDYTKTHQGENEYNKRGTNNNIYSSERHDDHSNNMDNVNDDRDSRDTNMTRTDDLTRTDNLRNTNYNKNLYSDTPQGAIVDLEANNYLTNATLDNGGGTNSGTVTNTGNVTDSGNITDIRHVENHGTDVGNANEYGSGTNNTDTTEALNGNDKYVEAVKGKFGGTDFSTLLKRYRETFMNIDLMVINELEDLFFQLW